MNKWIWTPNKIGQLMCKKATVQLKEATLEDSVVVQFAQLASPEETIIETQQNITVFEYGRPIRCQFEDLKAFDLSNPVQRSLTEQFQKSSNRCAMATLKSQRAPHFQSWFQINGLMMVSSLPLVADYVKENVEPETYPDSEKYYIGLASQGLMKIIRDCPAFRDWKEYLKEGDVLFYLERGSLKQIRWVEVLDDILLSNDEGVVMGKDALKKFVPEEPEVRITTKITESTDIEVAWFGVFGFVAQKERIVFIG